ncbi:MAG: hypothetical protein ACR2MA_02565, partial [Egibacteraceae bacterium]
MSSATVTDKVHGDQPPGGDSAVALLSVLNDTLDHLGAQILDGATSDAALRASIVALHRFETRVHAEKLRRLAELDARAGYLGEAAMSTAAWAKTRLGLTRGEAATLAATAVGLEALPQTAQALRDGQLGVGQAQAAVRAHEQLQASQQHTEPEPGADAEAARRAATDRDRQNADADADEVKETDEGRPAGSGGDAEPDGTASGQAGQARLAEQLDALAATAGRSQDRARLRQGLDAWANHHHPDYFCDREHQAFLRRLWGLGAEPDADGTVRIEGRLDPLGAAHV